MLVEAMKNNRHIEGVIWDFDGTLTDFDLDGASPVVNACVHAVLSLGVPLTPVEARELAQTGFERHGRFFPSFEQYGLNKREFHHAFYAALDSSVIHFSRDLSDAFGRCGLNNHVLLTHSARVWVEAGIRRLGLADYFPDKNILALEDFNFIRKHESQVPFTSGLEILNTSPGDTAVIEDTVRNLEIPHGMGMLTILVNRREPLSSRPGCVQHEARNAAGALEIIARTNVGSRAARGYPKRGGRDS